MSKFPTLEFQKLEFRITPTIDVDSAFAYKEKGLVRTIAGVAKDLIQRDFSNLKNRSATLIGNKRDPFDVFDRLISIQKKFHTQFVYFFLVGDYDKNDKSVSITSRKFQSVIKHVNDYSKVGLHPSFASNDDIDKLATERNRLSKVLHYPVVYSRQHFLKLHLPETYRNLMDLEMTQVTKTKNSRFSLFLEQVTWKNTKAALLPLRLLSLNGKLTMLTIGLGVCLSTSAGLKYTPPEEGLENAAGQVPIQRPAAIEEEFLEAENSLGIKNVVLSKGFQKRVDEIKKENTINLTSFLTDNLLKTTVLTFIIIAVRNTFNNTIE